MPRRPILHSAVLSAAVVLLPLSSALAGRRDDPARGVPRRIVEGDLRPYPTTEYVIGVGYGADREEARTRAVQSVAQQVSARIRSTVAIDDAYATTRDGSEQTSVEVATYASESEITSAFDRSDLVQVVETKQGRNQTWVVVALDRALAAEATRSRFSKLQADFRSRLATWKAKGDLPMIARQELEALRQRAEREWAMLSAFTGETSGFPDLFREIDALTASSSAPTLSFCISGDGRQAIDFELAETLLDLARVHGHAWEVCDRTNDRLPILNGLLKADVRDAPDGRGAIVCSVDVEFRLVKPGGALGGEGRTGGSRTRAVAQDAYDACIGATQLLVPDLDAKLSQL